MKVKLEIELELPDKYQDWSNEEINQLLFDEYVNYVTCAHLEDASSWCMKVTDEDEGAKIILEEHRMWGKICKAAKWCFQRT